MSHPCCVDADLTVSPGVVIPARELHERFSRSPGPGGQGVNTTDSRVQLAFDLMRSPSVPDDLRERALQRLGTRLSDGRIVVTASAQRSQLLNREEARKRLAALLAEAFAPHARARRPTRPSRGATERRITSKKLRSETKRLRRPADGE